MTYKFHNSILKYELQHRTIWTFFDIEHFYPLLLNANPVNML